MNAPRGIPVWIALLGSGLAGILVATQSRLNGGLGATIDNGILAAAVSFGAGLLVMVLAISLSPNGRAGLGRVRAGVRERGFPLWALLGGLCGAFFVITQGVAVGVLGVALFTVGIVAGQVVGGLVLDRIGLGPGGRVMPTVPRMFGAVLAVIAVAVSAWTGLGEASGVALLILPLLAGLAVSWQSAVNGLVRSVAESAITATFINFVIGTVALTVAAAVSVGVTAPTEMDVGASPRHLRRDGDRRILARPRDDPGFLGVVLRIEHSRVDADLAQHGPDRLRLRDILRADEQWLPGVMPEPDLVHDCRQSLS